MQDENFVPENVQIIGIRVKSIKRLDKKEPVYCFAAIKNGNMIANGIIVGNCDALRYAIATHKVSTFDEQSLYRKQEEYLKQKNFPHGYGFR
jgi:hypothetical protein